MINNNELNINKDFNGLKPHEVVNKVASDIMDIKNHYLTDKITEEKLFKTYKALQEYETILPIETIIDIKTSLFTSNKELFNEWDQCLTNIRLILSTHLKDIEETALKNS